MDDLKKADAIIGGKFKLLDKVGAGTFGDVYLGMNLENGCSVALKIEKNYKRVQLLNEYRMYQELTECLGIPKIIYFGDYEGTPVLVMELLGPSLGELQQKCKGKFTLKTVLQLAIQLIERIECIHSKGILHRDIKPNNLLTGLNKYANTVYITDFGLSMFFQNPKTKAHIMFSEGYNLIGTKRFASINCHKGYEQSRRDDMEAIGYTLIYFYKGTLPWVGIRATTSKQKNEKICEMKIRAIVFNEWEKLPYELLNYIKYCRSLSYEEKPNYNSLCKMFQNLFRNSRFEQDNKYDWNV